MKQDLKESKFRRIVKEVRTTRKHLLENPGKQTEKKLKRLYRYLTRIPKEWSIDSYHRVVIGGLTEVILEDLRGL